MIKDIEYLSPIILTKENSRNNPFVACALVAEALICVYVCPQLTWPAPPNTAVLGSIYHSCIVCVLHLLELVAWANSGLVIYFRNI
jgi:hypothetical protein